LRGNPYHISALYVVELERFRRELVGDQLTAGYQQLTADPNNLSNLDQDLPNFTQHQSKYYLYLKTGFGARAGVQRKRRPQPKPLIFVIIPA